MCSYFLFTNPRFYCLQPPEFYFFKVHRLVLPFSHFAVFDFFGEKKSKDRKLSKKIISGKRTDPQIKRKKIVATVFCFFCQKNQILGFKCFFLFAIINFLYLNESKLWQLLQWTKIFRCCCCCCAILAAFGCLDVEWMWNGGEFERGRDCS